jgi:hypothetical protein
MTPVKPIVLAAIQMGIIDNDVLQQFKKWGFLPRELDTTPIEDSELAFEAAKEALDSREYVEMRDTDLDLLRFYLDKNNQAKGQLVVIDHTRPEEDKNAKSTKTVVFARRALGLRVEYVVPWTHEENIETILTNGRTYLRYSAGGVNMKVYFTNIQEMYFGDVKAFMVCTGIEETHERG